MNKNENKPDINLLFIGNPNSIHDLKWAEHLADLYSNKIYFLATCKIDEKVISCYGYDKLNKIIFLKSLPVFSIVKINRLISGIIYLRKIISEYKINLIHISFATPNALWALFVNVKYVITIHGSDLLQVIPGLHNSNGIRSFYNKFLWHLFKKSFRKACAITCASNHLKNKFIELYGTTYNLSVIRSGVEINYIHQNHIKWDDKLPDDCKIVFSPRLISDIYDTYLQVQALDFLPDEIIKNYYFVFIGCNGNDYSAKILQKLIELEKGKGLKFKFYPFISQKQMFSLLHRSSLVIMTPKSDGTPSSALEAMTLQKPLIVSDLNYDAEIFENNCFTLKERSPEKLAQLIDEALHNYPASMLLNAYKAVNENGNIKIEMQKLKNIHESVLIQE